MKTPLALLLCLQLSLAPAVWAAKKTPAARVAPSAAPSKPSATIKPPNAREDDADYAEDVNSAYEDEGIPDNSALDEPLPFGRSRRGGSGSQHVGWRSRRSLGVWWNTYGVTYNGVEQSASGLPSIFVNGGSDYTFDRVYLGYDAELMTPQILWKGIGLGVFYFFCFFLSAGRCTANVPFATAPQDAGYAALGAHFGYHFAPLPLRALVGPDIGLFHNGMTPYLFSTLFLKLGAAWDFTDTLSLELMLRRSVIMSEWAIGNSNTGIANAQQLMLSLGVAWDF